MQANRGLVFWGVALVTAGAVALAIQSGTLPEAAVDDAWRLWPVVLIAVGVAVIASRTPFALLAIVLAGAVAGGLAGTLVAGAGGTFGFGCQGEATDRLVEDGTFMGAATVELEFNCGSLDVVAAAGSDWALDAGFSDDAPAVAAGDSSLRVEARGGGIPFNEARAEWAVTLPTDVTLDLAVEANAHDSRLDLRGADLARLRFETNAGSSRLDLRGAGAGELDIDSNAGSVTLFVDAGTTASGSIDLNAGSVTICSSGDEALAITVNDDNVTFSHDLDEAGLARSGDTWSRGDGPPAVTLAVEGNAGSLSLDPEDGCA